MNPTDGQFDSARACVGCPRVRGEPERSTPLALRVSPVYHLAHLFGPFRGFVEAQRPSLRRLETLYHPIPARARKRFDSPTAGVRPFWACCPGRGFQSPSAGWRQGHKGRTQLVWHEAVDDVIKHSHERPVIRRLEKLLAA